jgi:hypothetical protein
LELTKNISHSISHRIFLVLQKNHLTCLILDKNKTPLMLEEFEWLDEQSLTNYLKQRTYLNEIYSSSRLILVEPKFTLIPASYLLTQEEYETIYNLNHNLKTDEELVALEVDYEKQILCSVYSELHQPLSKCFPGLRTYHELYYILKDHRINKLQGQVIVIAWLRGSLFIAAINNNQLVLANNFDVKQEEELKYFTMLVCEQLEFKNEQCSLVILPSEITSSQKAWFFDYFNEVIIPDLSEIDVEKLSNAEQKAFLKSYVLHAALLCE